MVGSAFDQACFGALVDDIGEDTARTVVDVFFADTGMNLDRLQAMGCDATRKGVTIQAHAIKTTAATFGFHRLRALAQQLESDAEALSSADYPARLRELQAALAAARERFCCHGKALPQTAR